MKYPDMGWDTYYAPDARFVLASSADPEGGRTAHQLADARPQLLSLIGGVDAPEGGAQFADVLAERLRVAAPAEDPEVLVIRPGQAHPSEMRGGDTDQRLPCVT